MAAPMGALRETVEAFLANADLTTLELPRLSSAERREAKALLAEFPQLSSESFGLGEDRRLHLFKHAESLLAAQAYSIKNTFIDDFVPESRDEAVVLRSVPVGLMRAAPSQAERAGSPRVQAARTLNSTLVAESCGIERLGHLASPGASTCASPSHGGSSGATVASEGAAAAAALLQRSLSQTTSEADVAPAPLPSGYEVRNTFICGIIVDDDEPIDERTVQSMPHGMFRQHLLHDMCEQAKASASHATASKAPALAPPAAAAPAPQPCVPPTDAPCHFAPGADVMIHGLQKVPFFNGLAGKVESFDQDSGRYKVLLPAPVSGQRFAMVKADNLVPLLEQPAPAPAATATEAYWSQAEWQATTAWAGAEQWPAQGLLAAGPIATSGCGGSQVAAR